MRSFAGGADGNESGEGAAEGEKSVSKAELEVVAHGLSEKPAKKDEKLLAGGHGECFVNWGYSTAFRS